MPNNNYKESIKPIDKKILEIAYNINIFSHYSFVNNDLIIDKTTGLTNDGNFLNLLKQLFEALAEKYNLEINEGAILNIIVPLLKFIRDNKLQLEYRHETGELIGYNPEDKYSKVQFDLKNKPEGLQVAMYKPGNGAAETSILATLNGNSIKGKCYDKDLETYNNFNIKFNENGLLDTKEYQYRVFLSRRWPREEEPFLYSITKYGNENYQIKEFLIIGDKTLSFKNYQYQYMNSMNKIIDEMPGLISVQHIDSIQIHEISSFDNNCISYVFPELYSAAKYIESNIKKHTR